MGGHRGLTAQHLIGKRKPYGIEAPFFDEMDNVPDVLLVEALRDLFFEVAPVPIDGFDVEPPAAPIDNVPPNSA